MTTWDVAVVGTGPAGADVTSLISDPQGTATIAITNNPTNDLTIRRLDPYGKDASKELFHKARDLRIVASFGSLARETGKERDRSTCFQEHSQLLERPAGEHSRFRQNEDAELLVGQKEAAGVDLCLLQERFAEAIKISLVAG